MTAPVETSLCGILEETGDAFLRWSVTSSEVLGAWRAGSDAVLIRNSATRHLRRGPSLIGIGPGGDQLAELARTAAAQCRVTPRGVTVCASAYDGLPLDWGLRVRGRWDYMVAEVAPAVAPEHQVVRIDAGSEVDALLDLANPDAHARPGDADIAYWLGVRDQAGLACVGALAVTANGGAHLRAISTRPQARGRGLGSAVSAELTRRGLNEISPQVTLGVYSDNAGAIRVYERLGYRRVHRFVSAAVG
ncbi:MAG: GNAT family N-acetyltransferase [Nocardioidaceae bacterium]